MMEGAPFDNQRIETLLALLEEGYEDQILLAHYSVNVCLGRPPEMNEQIMNFMANWHPAQIFDNILPILRGKGISEAQFDKLLVKNAESFFAGTVVNV